MSEEMKQEMTQEIHAENPAAEETELPATQEPVT